MGAIERKAFIYARAILAGGRVDWQTGRVAYPRPGGLG